MTASSDSFTGWFRKDAPAREEEQAAETAAATTGGDLDQEPVVVWEAANLMEAQVVKGRLESEGIPAIIRGETLGAIYGLTTGSLAAADVLVPAPLAEKARQILDDVVEWDNPEPDQS